MAAATHLVSRRSSTRTRKAMVPWENNTVTVSVNSSPTASPPKCLMTPSPSKRALTRKDISTKIDAASERRKSYSMQKSERCRVHVQKVRDVSRASKEGFNVLLEMRRAELDRALEEASRRRMDMRQNCVGQANEGEALLIGSPRKGPADSKEKPKRRGKRASDEFRSEDENHSSAAPKRIAKQYSPRRRLFHEHPTATPVKFSPAKNMGTFKRDSLNDEENASRTTCKAQRKLFSEPSALVSRAIDSNCEADNTDGLINTKDEEIARLAAVRIFLNSSGVGSSTVQEFDHMTKTLRSKKTNLNALRALRVLECKNDDGEITPAAARVLLSAFMVSRFSEHVLDPRRDALDMNVLRCSRWMICALHHGKTLDSIRRAWTLWRACFAEWKSRDAEKIICAMIQDAVATEALRDSIIAKHMSEEEYQQWNVELDGKLQKIQEAVKRIGGDEAVTRLQSAVSGAKLSLNEGLVHEMMLDVNGLVEKLDNTKSREPEFQELERALRDELGSQPTVFTSMRKIECEIKNDLETISGQVVNIEPIRSVHDIDKLQELIREAGAYIKTLHEPIEDSNIDMWLCGAMEEIAFNPATVLMGLRRKVFQLRQRVSKANILALAPTIQINGVQYESSRFQEKLKNGLIHPELPNTRQWLAACISTMSSIDEQGIRRGKHSSCEMFLKHCIIEVVDSSDSFALAPVPEVLRLDVERIVGLQNDLQRATLLACLHHLCQGFIRRKTSHVGGSAVSWLNLTGVAQKLKALEFGEVTEVEQALVQCVSSSLESVHVNLSDSENQAVRDWVRASVRDGDALYGVLRRRLGRRFREAVLSGGGGGELRIQELEACGFRRAGGGAEVAAEIISSATALVRHTWAVHSSRLRDTMNVVVSDMNEAAMDNNAESEPDEF
ncbi:hypothetical protein NDN08_006274 [Rhodosorus marinus]|uniref:Uncharacterized protein n=1 Tax=Rhodosorus marinus TaxID=101924 RepID=A0AAV8UNR9_9RHOD|nr:hypothetical protein NDN08_006274 [Rhodosorus marinus]